MPRTLIDIAGFALDPELHYDPLTHMWVEQRGDGVLRVGFDPLGRETSGDVVSISLAASGTAVERGGSFGDVEAAKLVGPLLSPVGGTIAARNEEVLRDPGAVNLDPFEAWLVELRPGDDLDAALSQMYTGESIGGWFAEEVQRFKEKGMIAE